MASEEDEEQVEEQQEQEEDVDGGEREEREDEIDNEREIGEQNVHSSKDEDEQEGEDEDNKDRESRTTSAAGHSAFVERHCAAGPAPATGGAAIGAAAVDCAAGCAIAESRSCRPKTGRGRAGWARLLPSPAAGGATTRTRRCHDRDSASGTERSGARRRCLMRDRGGRG